VRRFHDKSQWGTLEIRSDGVLIVMVFTFCGLLSFLGLWKLTELVIQFSNWL
jgi:hypothetical protein